MVCMHCFELRETVPFLATNDQIYIIYFLATAFLKKRLFLLELRLCLTKTIGAKRAKCQLVPEFMIGHEDRNTFRVNKRF